MNEKLEIIVDKKLKFIKSNEMHIEFKGTYVHHKEDDSVSTLQLFYSYRIPQRYNNNLIEILHDEFHSRIIEHNHTIELQKYAEHKQTPERLSLKIKIPKDKYKIRII